METAERLADELFRDREEDFEIGASLAASLGMLGLILATVGVYGVMSYLVEQRTREIGVRRAMGARRSDVLAQFLSEAIVLSVAGGLVGVIVGFGLTETITLYAGWRTVISFPAIALAFVVSVGVGIAFGYYPARKAAYQNPIDALRYE